MRTLALSFFKNKFSVKKIQIQTEGGQVVHSRIRTKQLNTKQHYFLGLQTYSCQPISKSIIPLNSDETDAHRDYQNLTLSHNSSRPKSLHNSEIVLCPPVKITQITANILQPHRISALFPHQSP